MSALKRTHPAKTVRLMPGMPDPPESFRKSVNDCLGAKSALAKVTRRGSNEELFWRGLWEIAYLAGERKLRPKHWYTLPGLPLDTLRRLPQRVRSWADEIENVGHKIESNEVYSLTAHSLRALLLKLQAHEVGTVKLAIPEVLARGLSERRAQLPKLPELPNLLRLYADFIEAVFKSTAHHASRAPARVKRDLEWALIECVKWTTGKTHIPEIATLITAAYHAHGSSEIVDASDLKMRYSRYSRRKQ